MIHGPIAEPADQKQKERELELIRQAAREIAKDRKKFLRMAVATGMYTKTGKLKKRFQ